MGSRPIDGPEARLILDFLARIGIPVAIGPIGGETFLPAMRIRGGALQVDPDRLQWPGDLLHEAGHIAVTEPGRRPFLDEVPDDPGEEMAAIAWSWAAAAEIGIEPATLFHPDGYRGGSAALLTAFADARGVGIPMLAWFGMTAEPHRAARDGMRPYPHMTRWLR